jgi:hypothetical protein
MARRSELVTSDLPFAICHLPFLTTLNEVIRSDPVQRSGPGSRQDDAGANPVVASASRAAN